MINYLSKKQKTIGGAVLILSFFTVVAQILGIVKNKLFAIKFGAGQELDIFYTAFKIPDVIFLLIGTMAVGAILIPIFLEKEKKSVFAMDEYLRRFFNSFSLLIVLISFLVFLFMPIILEKIFPIYSGEKLETLILLSRMILLSPIFMGISNFFISINQKNKIFLPMALTGVFYNLSIIFSTIFLVPYFGIIGLGYGVILGAFLHLAIQLPAILKNKLFKYKFEFLKKKEVFDLLKITLPRSVALSVSTIILIYLYSKISDLEIDGLITIFSFAFAIFWIPVALLNTSYSSASLPVLAELFIQKKCQEFSDLIRNILSQILFFAIPISVFFFTFSDLIISILFGSEKFLIKEVNSTAIILSLFSLMIIFQILLLVISKIYYAMGETKPVMYVNLFAGILIILLFNFTDNFTLDDYFEKWKVIEGFSELFKFVLLFVISYISAGIFMIFKLRKKIQGKNIFNFQRLIKKIFISLLSVGILKFIWFKFNFHISISDGQNLKNILWVGISFIILFIIFSEILKEENYLKFKKKIIKK